MTPEERFRRLSEAQNWTFRFTPRTDAAQARRKWAPWAVSLATIAAVAVVGVIVFSLFGLSIQNVRNPVVPAVPSATPTATPGAARPDDGRVASPQFIDAFGDRATETIVDLDGRLSLPWVKVVDDGTQLVIAYVVDGTGGGCGEHVGVQVDETDTSVTIAAVNTPMQGDVSCTAIGQTAVGTVMLRDPLGSRTLVHAALSSPWDTAENPIPTVPGPQIRESLGSATCATLLDDGTASDLSKKGVDDISDRYAEKAMGSESEFHRFLLYGGLVCARSGGGPDVGLGYAFGPITDAQATYEKSRLTKLAESTGDGVEHYQYGPDGERKGFIGEFAFASGFWAYAFDNGGGNVLDEVMRNGLALSSATSADSDTGEPAKPATPAKAPYLTSEGLGTLRLGEKIPDSNPFTTWDASSCGDRGGWALTKAYGGAMNFDMSFVTTDRLKDSPLQNIVLRNDTIPTKSGIRVGDSLATLKATYKKFDQVLTDPNAIYVIEGDKGEVAFELVDDTIVSIALFPIGTEYLSTQNTDGLSGCSN